MKNIFPLLAILLLFNVAIQAQCDKQVSWLASKADFIDTAGNVQDTKNVKIAVHTNSKGITIIHSDDETDTLHGNIKELTCDWEQPYKQGKMSMKADLSDKQGDYPNSIITIEAIDAKIFIMIKLATPDGEKLIKIPVDSYTEG